MAGIDSGSAQATFIDQSQIELPSCNGYHKNWSLILCGLVGIWRRNDSYVFDSRKLQSALDLISHRGPEGTSVLADEDFFVGHAHLTFHKHGESEQPYRSSCGKYIIAFNGEIYNYAELRLNLQDNGHIFFGSSESELILRLYIEHGERFTTYIRGMYAIALRDRDRDRLVLARDFIGKKPLYFFRDERGVFFASELSALKPFLASRELDPAGFTSYFLMNAVDSRHCLIAGVEKLPPASMCVFSRTAVQMARNSDIAIPVRLRDSEEIGETLTMLLRRAVTRRLNTSAPLGVMLSGGLDSSLVAALAAEQGHMLPSFSARFDHAGYDETPFAARVSGLFCSRHEIVEIPDRGVADAAEHYLGRLDEPIADPSFLAVALVSAVARQSCKGLLTGDGADDLFAGYSFFRAVPMLTFLSRRMPPGTMRWVQHALANMTGRSANLSGRTVLQLLSRGTSVAPEWQHAFCTSALAPAELGRLLTRDARALVRWPLDTEAEPPVAADPIRRAQLGIIRTFLQAPILSKLDRGGMANGLELRNPFLDEDLAKYALSICSTKLVNRTGTKAVLREVAEKFLPEEILQRKKQGFRLPVRKLLCGSMRTLLLDTLTSETLNRHGVFDAGEVNKLITEHLDQGLDRSKTLWSLLAFQLWQTGFSGTAQVAQESRVSEQDEIWA